MSERDKIIAEYYEKSYTNYLFDQNDLTSKGIDWFERQIEKFFEKDLSDLEKVLELGGGAGEHLKFLNGFPQEYYSIDRRSSAPKKDGTAARVIFIQGSAEHLPFNDEFFDRVFSTCLLHHVDDPLQVMIEARRVTKAGGEIAFLLPTDPGMLNTIIKKTITFRKLRKISVFPPELIYALDHPNSIKKIMSIFDFVFVNDSIKRFYRPFYLPTTNWNLAVVLKVNKKL